MAISRLDKVIGKFFYFSFTHIRYFCIYCNSVCTVIRHLWPLSKWDWFFHFQAHSPIVDLPTTHIPSLYQKFSSTANSDICCINSDQICNEAYILHDRITLMICFVLNTFQQDVVISIPSWLLFLSCNLSVRLILSWFWTNQSISSCCNPKTVVTGQIYSPSSKILWNDMYYFMF